MHSKQSQIFETKRRKSKNKQFHFATHPRRVRFMAVQVFKKNHLRIISLMNRPLRMPKLKNQNKLSIQNWLLLSSSSKSDGKLKETEDDIVHLTTLHYTINYTALNYSKLHYTNLNFTTLNYSTLFYTTLCYINLHFTTLHTTNYTYYFIVQYITLYGTTIQYRTQYTTLYFNKTTHIVKYCKTIYLYFTSIICTAIL